MQFLKIDYVRLRYAPALSKTFLIMRWLTLFLFAACMQVSARSHSQTVTLNVRQAKPEAVMKIIQQQTGYFFFYDPQDMKAAPRVSINLRNETLNNTLNLCFKEKGYGFSIAKKTIFITRLPVGEKRETTAPLPAPEPPPLPPLKIRVVDSLGNPLQGASVTVKGKKGIGTTSNANGEFTLDVLEGDVLEISFVGYEPQSIKVTAAMLNQQLFTVRLKIKEGEMEDLGVMVNTGYQNLRGNKITGAVQVLDRKALNQQVGINILDRLNNIAPGVFIDNNANKGDLQKLNISLRGLSTINGPRDPVVVLDGFIYEGEINNIDPNTIESVTLLKDAAASSIWGARAGNGVIVLTTKKGNANRKVTIQLNESVTLRSKPDLHKVFQMPAKDFIEIEKLLFKNGYYDIYLNNYPYIAHTPAIEYLQMEKKGSISTEEMNAKLAQLSLIDGRDEYSKYFLRNPVLQQYSASVSGGSNINTFNFGLGYTNDLNENSGTFKKVNLTLANRFTPTKKSLVDLNVYYTNSNTKTGSPAFNSFSVNGKRYPYMQFTDSEGNPTVFEDSYRKVYTDTMFRGGLQSWDYIPLEDYKHINNLTNIEELYASLNGSYEILSFLKATIGYQVQKQNSINDVRYDPESRFARSTVNEFANFDVTTGSITYPIPKGGIRSLSTSVRSSYTLRGQLDVNKSWRDQSLIGVLGWEMRQNQNESNEFTAYGYTDDPLKTIAVNYQQSYPLYLSQYSLSIPGAPSFGKSINRFVSTYANLIYVLMNKYGISASMRRDGANIFGATTNDKWKPFMSFGAYWNLSNEEFLNTTKIDLFKVRASYGFSGNVDLRKTPLPIAGAAPNSYTSFPALAIGTLNDPSLRWERIRTLNFGLDFSAFKRVLTGSIDYYRKKGSDLYGLAAYDYTVWGRGFTITKNMAAMQGNGVDLLLTVRNVDRKFKWFTTYNFSINKNKTISYFAVNPVNEAYFIGSSSTITPIPGLPLYSISAYKWAGLDKDGNPQGYVDGKPSTDYDAIFSEAFSKGTSGNMVYVGSSKPQYWGSIINQIVYQNFTLSFNISYQGGYYFLRNATSNAMLFEKGLAYSDIMQRWLKPGDELVTNVPSLLYPANSSRDGFYNQAEINILKGDHLRFQYMNLSWEPRARPSRSKISSRIFFNTSNLGILWRANKENIDPEFPDQVGPLKSYTVGLNLNF